jgi:hypothetical protein
MEFLDILYLGVFAILSPAFDVRFYHAQKPARSLVVEITCAISHFRSILAAFSERYIILLEGVPMRSRYVFDRMLAEFAAATVVFAKAVDEKKGDRTGDGDEVIKTSEFIANLEEILKTSYPTAFPYYSRCLERGHSYFIWTGPKLQIVPRSEDSASILPLVSMGEMLDHPTHSIYEVVLEDPELPATPIAADQVLKHPAPEDGDSPASRPTKRRRKNKS